MVTVGVALLAGACILIALELAEEGALLLLIGVALLSFL